MKVAQISRPGGDFEVVERELPHPKPNEVRIKVEACGICHSDMFVKEGHFPGITYPRVPGHEVVGIIDQVGSNVKGWKPGQRVGVGWHGGHCFECDSCARGKFNLCAKELICGISYDGGYAEYMVAPQEALALVPEELSSVQAAPLLCAGITTYNSLRHSPALPGDRVAVQGIGGLGHLAIQIAAKMGFHTIALSSGEDKRKLAFSLGAKDYIDTSKGDPAQELQKLGGVKVILTTAPNKKAIESIIDGLGTDGQLLIVAAPAESIEISPIKLIMKRNTVSCWPSGHAKDSEDTLNFCSIANVAPMVEEYPLDKVNEAYKQMISNKARFRVVLNMSKK